MRYTNLLFTYLLTYRRHPIWLILGRNISQGIWNKHIRIHSTAHHISILYVCTVPCKN